MSASTSEKTLPDQQSIDQQPIDKWPLILIGLAVLVRAVYWWEYLQTPLLEWVLSDQGYYSRWAQRIAAGDFLGEGTFEKGPLYAYLLAVGYALGLNNAAVAAVQLMTGTLNSVLVYACGRRLFNQQTAIIAGILAAVFGPLVFYECMIMKTFLSPLLTMVALYTALRYEESDAGVRWLLASGAAIGLASLNRESHILLLPPVMLWAWLIGNKFSLSRSERCQHAIAVAVGFGLMLVPSMVRNYVVAGEFVAVTSGGGEVFYMAHGPFATGYYQPPDFVAPMPSREHEDFRHEAQRRTGRELSRAESSRYWSAEGMRAIRESPLRTAKLTLYKAAILLSDFECPDSGNYDVTRPFTPILYILPTFGWICGLGLLGMTVCLPQWQRYLLPLGLVAMHAASVLIIYNFGRFRVGMMPVWILFAAHGLVWMATTWRRGARGRFWGAAAGLVLVTYFSLFVRPVGYHDTLFEYGGRELSKRISTYLERTGRRDQLLSTHSANPEDTQTLVKLAEVSEELGQRDSAVEYYHSALKIDEKSAVAHHGLATVLAKMNDPQQAETHFRLALENEPDFAAAQRDLGTVLVRGGRFDEAVIHLRRAVELSPDDADAQMWLGIALMQLPSGSNEQAAAQFRKAIELDPKHAFARYYLAKLLAARGKYDEAIEQLEQAVDSDSLFTDAHRLLIELRAARESAGAAK